MMKATRNLKLFIFLSLGIHLFAFSILSALVPDLDLLQLPRLMEVSFLPLENQEKELQSKEEKVFGKTKLHRPKAVNVREVSEEAHSIEENEVKRVEKKEEEVQMESTPIPRRSIEVTQVEKMELPSLPKDLKPETIVSIPSDNKVVSINEHQLVSIEIAKKESEEEGRVVLASLGPSIPPPLPFEPPHMVFKESTPSDKGILLAQPRYAENPKPHYPKEAKRKGYQGEVLLRVEVLSNGTVGEIEIKRSSGYEILDRSALTAVKEWKFIPAKRGETTIPVWVNVPIAFQLR